MSEFDRRQLNIMLEKIKGFELGQLHLSSLIYDLEALLNILEGNDLNWKDDFRGFWWDLEQVYAVALTREKKHFDSEDKNIILEAIENLTKLIELKLDSDKDFTKELA